ncbi:hypothetical protein LC040_02560 [Bacillus tianshenii]|nr:hypothetical protein LC040_02560 [Bacillus tianshenii]
MKNIKGNFYELTEEAVSAVREQDFDKATSLLDEIERISKVVISSFQEIRNQSLPK